MIFTDLPAGETVFLESDPEEGLTRLTQPWHTAFSSVPRLCQP
jgi:hypothetical protein